jgi:anti-sigma regulatory factor (Ser/Thr protein kinase)
VQTLQRSLLPERLPRNSGLELAARYRPSGVAPQIGGDWYDALELDSGRTALMIGDVVGHGIRAATTMSELRNALRAFAVEGHGPSTALHRLNRLVYSTLGRGMIATVLCLIIDTAEGAVSVASAGHPAPVVRRRDGRVELLETEHTLPLGIEENLSVREARYPIAAGETVLLFTDGLIERRQESISLGYERLQAALASAPADVEELCNHILQQTIDPLEGHDDVALLAVRVPARADGPLELTLPAVPDSVPLARRRLRAWLGNIQPVLDRTLSYELELVFSEVCTNVIRHAYPSRGGTFTATVAKYPDGVTFEIRDQGRWRLPDERRLGYGLALMRRLSDELTIDQRPDGTTVKMRRQLERDPSGPDPTAR